MTEHQTHDSHPHRHQAGCGHISIRHEDHTDYLHDGHLHHLQNDHIDEHILAVGRKNPATCTPLHDCEGHDSGHKHRAGCGHEAVPHGDHVDYLVKGHLHFVHRAHCDDHGFVAVL